MSSWLRKARRMALALAVANLVVIALGAFIVLRSFLECGGGSGGTLAFAFSTATAAVRIAAMWRTGVAQEAIAMTIVGSSAETLSDESDIRRERRMMYKRWLWWARFSMATTVLQFGGASYLMFILAKHISQDGTSNYCVLGEFLNVDGWKHKMLVSFMITVCGVAIAQCFTGSDVLRWRSFYATQDSVWKSHYREVFDHGIREVLCCLGRAKYLSAGEEDEIHSVAHLLGDLVAYRATGTGHLAFLAGLALLQRQGQYPIHEGLAEASKEQIQEAVSFHKFAEAAYTGPLLDVGRNPMLFPFSWLHRQGILTSWTRNRRPILEGDNWWRGHAAAFLKYVNLSPEVLLRGRVKQEKCEAAYFIVVLHHSRSVVISVRGTETPEDLIIDGLCRECSLSEEDLDGLINTYICPDVRRSVVSSFPHYGHSGIVEAARDLFMQIEGNPENHENSYGSSLFLSSLLGVGCECEGYNVRIVGHSLGGAIAALLGMRLYGRYPKLHVFSYGPLPCVDAVIAGACSKFITSIVYDNEFSSRLSVGSILRLRAAAIKALCEDTETDTTISFKLARRFLYAKKFQGIEFKRESALNDHSEVADGLNPCTHCIPHIEESWLQDQADIKHNSDGADSDNPLDEFISSYGTAADVVSSSFSGTAEDVISFDDPVCQFMEDVQPFGNGPNGNPVEMFLPGIVIHIVPQLSNSQMHLQKGWRLVQRKLKYKAYVANREDFKDIIVSPYMFVDHFPWRCHYAMTKVLEAQTDQSALDDPQLV